MPQRHTLCCARSTQHKSKRAPSIYRTTASITSTNLARCFPMHKEQALSCHCLPLPSGRRMPARKSPEGRRGQPARQYPSSINSISSAAESYRPHSYLARIIRGAPERHRPTAHQEVLHTVPARHLSPSHQGVLRTATRRRISHAYAISTQPDIAKSEELASNLREQIARNPNHTAMEKVELEDVQGWLRLRDKEAAGSPSNDIAF